MANLKEIRNRITSVSSTMQITSAMKMVSAAKLKRAQDAVADMMPYSNKLQEILSGLSSSLDASENIYSAERDINNVVLVVVTSNRGLCGAFNNNIHKSISAYAKDAKAKGINVTVYGVGKRAADFFNKIIYFRLKRQVY